jgi:hypothetical protein
MIFQELRDAHRSSLDRGLAEKAELAVLRERVLQYETIEKEIDG